MHAAWLGMTYSRIQLEHNGTFLWGLISTFRLASAKPTRVREKEEVVFLKVYEKQNSRLYYIYVAMVAKSLFE